MNDRETIEAFASDHGLRASYDGEIGFGRECVGLLDDSPSEVYVAWGKGAAPPNEVTDAYHKDDYIAVLGYGEEAERQLAVWCEALRSRGVTFQRVPKEVEDLASLVLGLTDEMTAMVPA